MTTWLEDLRHAARALARSRGIAVAAILTLGLGIGASTAVFSIVEGVLLRALPYPEPARIVQVSQLNTTGKPTATSQPNFEDWHAESHSFQALARYASFPTTVVGGSEPVRVRAAAVSGEFFEAFGAQP